MESICQRTIIIAEGKIKASGTINEVRERIKGASRLIAEIRGPRQEVENAIRQINGVKSVDSSITENWNRLRIESTHKNDIREEIATLANNKNWGLRELKLEVGSLEEYFVQITAEASEKDKTPVS